MKATEVFTPGAFPKHTYVAREGTQLEQRLRDALDTPGNLISLNGPSKSGKTVLVEKIVGTSGLIAIQGTGIKDPEEVWDRVLDRLGIPAEETTQTSYASEAGKATKGSGSAGVPGVFGTSVERTVTDKTSSGSGTSRTTRRGGLDRLTKEIGGTDFVILVDDFHYMSKTVQAEVAKVLKEGIRQNIKICTAAALHRADDVVRALPELRGRVTTIDLEYWDIEDLTQVAIQGFTGMNIICPDYLIKKFAVEAAGSPQLMQRICLDACLVMGARESAPSPTHWAPTPDQIKAIFEQASSTTDFRSLVDVVDAGPKSRGAERKEYKFTDGTKGDVYRCILKAIAQDPPMLSFDYDEITRRTKTACIDDHPVGSSVIGSCQHMDNLAKSKFPDDLVLDWDEQKQILEIPDPYFLFYLRWSNRLQEE